MEINELIKSITPLYNKYKINQSQTTGAKILELLWEIGDIIKLYLNSHQVAPHALYRQIYGKSEQAINATQKSYITREFLSRAYRIRNIFLNKLEIYKILPGLVDFNMFREAMPFFDNPKYVLIGKEKNELLKVLNSKKTNKQIKEYIRLLQKERIGINNPRTQRLQELASEKKLFIDLYNFVYKQYKNKKYKEITKDLSLTDNRFISSLSKNTGALASDQLFVQEFDIPADTKGLWREYAVMVNKLAEKKDAKVRRRFRRLVPPEKMIRLSEMIYAMRNEEDFNKFRI